MHNWYAMEVEAESRRQEWERARIAADRAAEAEASAAGRVGTRQLPRPRLSFSHLRSLVVPVAAGSAPRPAGC
jgi:hypothetical protein